MIGFEIGSTVVVNHERWRVVNIQMQGTLVDFGTNTRVSVERAGMHRGVTIPSANVSRADLVTALSEVGS